MEINNIEYTDLENALLAINDKKAVVHLLMLDALHNFRHHGISSRGIAIILQKNEEVLCSTKEKIDGIIDALKEYQLIHPVHHSVFDQIWSMVENECINRRGEPQKWVENAFRLLSGNYDRKRLEALLSIANGPLSFEIADHYIAYYIKTVVRNINAAKVLESGYEKWSEQQLKTLRDTYISANNQGYKKRVEYIRLICDTIEIKQRNDTVDSTNNMKRHKNILAEIINTYDDEYKKDHIRWQKIVNLIITSGALLFLICIVFFTAYIIPFVTNKWSQYEATVNILQIVVPIIVMVVFFVLVINGIIQREKITDKIIKMKNKYINKRMSKAGLAGIIEKYREEIKGEIAILKNTK